jgi:hypothetical protein
LLLIIVPAVCNESNSPFGDSTVCSSYGMAYASLSMAVRFIFIMLLNNETHFQQMFSGSSQP